jgi:hypothetical protein
MRAHKNGPFAALDANTVTQSTDQLDRTVTLPTADWQHAKEVTR